MLQTLVNANNFQEKIKVITGKIEEIDLPEMVDVIISEPMGYMLYNERMLETYLHAKKWLKPGGKLFQTFVWSYDKDILIRVNLTSIYFLLLLVRLLLVRESSVTFVRIF